MNNKIDHNKPFYPCCHEKRKLVSNILVEIECLVCEQTSHIWLAEGNIFSTTKNNIDKFQEMKDMLELKPDLLRTVGAASCQVCHEGDRITYIYTVDIKN